jgi:hypothetical protein
MTKLVYDPVSHLFTIVIAPVPGAHTASLSIQRD